MKIRLPVKFGWVALLYTLLVSGILIIAQFILNYDYTKQQITTFEERSFDLIAKMINAKLLLPLGTEDKAGLEVTLREITELEEVYIIEIRTAAGQLIQRVESSDFRLEAGIPLTKHSMDIIDARKPITVTNNVEEESQRRILGVATIYFSNAKLIAISKEQTLTRTLLFITIVVLLMLFSFFIARQVEKFITRHLLMMNQIRQGEQITASPGSVFLELDTLDSELVRLGNDLQQVITELRKEKEKSKALNRHKDDLIRTLSHEVKTPINTINLLVGLISTAIERTRNTPESTQVIKDNLRVCMAAITELKDLINDLFDFTTIETGKINCSPSLIAPESIFAHLWQRFYSDCQAKGLTFSIRQTDDYGGIKRMAIDKTKATRIIINLIENAIKFTRNGFVQVEWSVVGDKHMPGTFNVWVKDSGIGIPEKEISKIFDKFYRVEQPDINEFRGFGIGLPYARKLLDAMNGKMTAHSRENTGSTFHISIPVELETGDESQIDPLTLLSKRNIDSSELKIVAIDDDAHSLHALKYLAKTLGYDVTIIGEPERALAYFESHSADLIYIDYHLPGIDGVQLLAKLKNNERLSGTTFICITADNHGSTKNNLLRNDDWDSVIFKPFEPDEIARTINRVQNAIDFSRSFKWTT